MTVKGWRLLKTQDAYSLDMVMLHLQIMQEERYLESAFGTAYTEYKKQVFRYLGRKLI